MLRNGDVDIYTAAKKTPQREEEFAFSTHPAITSSTCMNVKVGNNRIVPGDYSTYNGIRIGFLKRHTYNDSFLDFAREKGFDCRIIYYETPTELTNALINDEVDALVNSYIRIPEDEKTIENFGETPYYIMARKEDQGTKQALLYSIFRSIRQIFPVMIASYTGWKYEYIYGEWNDLFEKLKNGDIDLMAGVAYSKDREDLISYPDAEMINETFYIYKDENDNSMQCGNISSYHGKKIGTLKNDQRMTTCCGMGWEFLEKIFVPFERQNNSTISGIQGTGLGMTIVKGFVDAMGGTIDIISEENRGTEIIVRLCQRLAEPPESPEKSKNFSYSPELFAGKRILLVEDNSMNREIASAILEESGLIIDTA